MPGAKTVELVGAQTSGQRLRTALTLSLITGRSFRLRASPTGDSPGLRPADLAYLRAAESLGGRAKGAQVGSALLEFEPQPVQSGRHVIELGAGANAAQAWEMLFFPLALSGGGELVLRGATHVADSPSYPYLRWIWMAGVTAFGFRASLSLKAAGFAQGPAGEVRGSIPAPDAPPERVTLLARGMLRDVDVTSYVANLPLELAERQARAAVMLLREQGLYSSSENIPLPGSGSAASAVFVRAQFENSCAGFTAVGERGNSPEEIGRAAAAQLADFMRGSGAVDEHLSEQLLIPAALLAAGRLGPPGLTRYASSAGTEVLQSLSEVIREFIPVVIDVEESAEGQMRVEVRGAASGA